ncbi:unnamed protein product [Adineta steineri]|uniref:Transposase n=1 Tax=Adineta steineri TaxID=433720 RepID=A0A815HFT1_9BILA|nr:unnamed protein product [Adineta steineri]CAF4130389.1 unnamed protein product [Adineta steineri]
MATSTTYDKQQILEMVKQNNPLIEFVKPKHVKSLKWNNYLQIYVNGTSQAFISCRKCFTVLAWKPSDGTNVMEKHDKACKQQPSSSSIQQSIKLFCSTDKKVQNRLIQSTKRKLTDTLAECCATDSLPFNFVNGIGFKELTENLIKFGRQLGSGVLADEILPDATTISRQIDKIYNFRKEQLKSYLSTIDHYVITVDFWSESKTKIHYGGVTIHTYTEEHGLLVFVLACKPYDLPSQTADNIRLFTDKILESYDLDLHKVKYVVSDNENKMRASFRSNINRIGCSTHFINKIIEHSLCVRDIDCDDIQRLFNNIHDLVVYLRQSHNQSKLSKKLQLFSKTRWNSAYDMLSSFIDVFPELNCIITDKDRKSIFATIDFEELLAFAKYLKYFVDVTELLSAEKTPTIHLVLPFKQRLINLSKPDENDLESIQKFKRYFKDQIPSYWELDDIHYIATILHPNMKHLQICSSNDKKKAYDLLKKEIRKRESDQATVTLNLNGQSQQTLSLSNDVDNFLTCCFDQSPATIAVVDANDELKRYLRSTDTLIDDEDLLTFWKRHKSLYPVLYSIACVVLIIPASNTAVERLFSASGKTVTNVRTRLSAQKVDKLMFIKKNLSILKKIFAKTDKSNSSDDCFQSMVKQCNKRPHESLSDIESNDIINLNYSNDDGEE